MATSPARQFRLSGPSRDVGQWVLFIVLAVFSFSLLVIHRVQPAPFATARQSINDMSTAVLTGLGVPVTAAKDAGDFVTDMISLREENDRLREANLRMLEWKAEALRLGEEQARLADLLNLQLAATQIRPVLTTRVVGDDGGPFVNTVLLAAGRKQGLEEGQVAADSAGLVGRLLEVGRSSARVLLVRDLNSRVPVIVEPGGAFAIMEGDNSARPRLAFLPIDAEVNVGDRVVTSGHGGVFPPRLPVGEVVSKDGAGVKVRLFADLDRLEFVRVLAFEKVLPPEPDPVGEAAGDAAMPGPEGP